MQPLEHRCRLAGAAREVIVENSLGLGDALTNVVGKLAVGPHGDLRWLTYRNRDTPSFAIDRGSLERCAGYNCDMKTAALVLFAAAIAGPAAAGEAGDYKTVTGTPQMNSRMDGVTPGAMPVGALYPNRATPPTCRPVSGRFAYPDGSVRRETMTRCE